MVGRPRLSFKKENGKYIDDRLNVLLSWYSKGKSLENSCGKARICDVVIYKYLNKKEELFSKNELTEEDLEIMEFINDFVHARYEGQDKWLKAVEDLRDNPQEVFRKPSADISISMMKLYYTELRDKKDKEEKGGDDGKVTIILGSKKDGDNDK